METLSFALSSRAARMKASEIRELLKLLGRPGMISFAGGIPDPALFDVAAFREAYAAALAEGGVALQYSTSEGYPPLREWIARHMATRGVSCTPDNILITHGSQQGLDLIGKLAIDPGDVIATAAPTYLGALQSFSACEPGFAGIDFAGRGARTEANAAKLVYLVPDFDNPTGRTLDLAARRGALALARRFGAILVEDAAYASLRYDGTDLPAIAALDQEEAGSIEGTRTLYCGTFSKTLSPGLRVGWVCGPEALIHRLTLIKQAADLHTATINQQVVHHVATHGFDAQVARARAVYRARRDLMLAALDRFAPAGMSWTRPEGGLFIWVTLPPSIDAADLLREALDHNVAFVPGGAFFTDGSGANTLRLSFSLADAASCEAGIGTLCRLIAARVSGEREAGPRRAVA